jgi:multifunctional 2-oxoglutarate metabolism enzyme
MASNAETPSGSQSELNTWLVEEMYEQYREDPSSLSKSWRDFFADYRPDEEKRDNGADQGAGGKSASKPSAEPARQRAAARVTEDGPEAKPLRGVGARIVENMETSLGVPTATSVRDVPAKLLEVNRKIVNNYLRRTRGGKVSFTHLIAYAMVKAVRDVPAMKNTYAETDDGKPAVINTDDFGLGLAVDIQNDDGSRTLLVPVIQDAENLPFDEFLRAYEELIRKIRTKKLDPAMFSGGTITITNPGTIGTVHSIPRLMSGQSAILGVGSIDYPPGYQAADPRVIAKLGVSKVITLTSTYDHRVIQGAESGLFLKRVHEFLLGGDGFYDDVFQSLGLPYEPARWRADSSEFDSETDLLVKQMHVDQLFNMYRVRGHLIADLDPLRLTKPSMHPELDPTYYGLSIWDLDREFVTDVGGQTRRMELGDALGVLRDAYCRTIGIEYGHVLDPDQKRWIREQVEGANEELSETDQQWVLERLNAAEAFESFLHTKYVGQKRFGIEGAESLIPLLEAVIEQAADDEVNDVVLGMAHRGRLNVLSNILHKSYRQLFGEFEGHIDPETVQGSGDVKYHLGQRGTYTTRSGSEIDLHMPPNPSHLEAVNPVVEGIARALQDRYDRGEEFPVLPLLMHGDAAFAGQGVVVETLNLSQLRGYRTGGTVHVVINNQVGFTTSPDAARSSFYATDVAKTVQAPILHVNGDDPEAVVRVARLAYAYRQQFHRDIVIDLICYRRHGHNEADDPSFTQPQMYELIDNQRSVRKVYTERLVRRGDISIEKAEEFLEDFESRLQQAFDETKQAAPPEPPKAVRPEEARDLLPAVETGVERERLDHIASVQFDTHEGFTRHPKLDRIFKKAKERYDAGSIDWALGETLAFGSLLLEGTNVRVAGQDSRRGTFSQRHAVQVDFKTGEEFLPLAHLADEDEQGKWFIYDSLLSEYAAVGFEYGYSAQDKDALVCWEAQFGDFVNGAQVVIDQFLVAGEDKWDETSGLVLLLPHGYEGQGPEHSSARIERFLTLCAEDNMRVCNATTAAQYFHLLRRQVHQEVRKPLVVFTPKSLLRSPNAFSALEEFTSGSFRETLDDPAYGENGDRDPSDVTAVTLSFGKVAYDVMKERDERELDVAVVRCEQLYPWPADQIGEILQRYPNAKDVCWVQEEPENMGGWGFVAGRIREVLDHLDDGRELRHAARVASASPATGQHVVHDQELEQLLDDIFDPVAG